MKRDILDRFLSICHTYCRAAIRTEILCPKIQLHMNGNWFVLTGALLLPLSLTGVISVLNIPWYWICLFIPTSLHSPLSCKEFSGSFTQRKFVFNLYGMEMKLDDKKRDDLSWPRLSFYLSLRILWLKNWFVNLKPPTSVVETKVRSVRKSYPSCFSVCI